MVPVMSRTLVVLSTPEKVLSVEEQVQTDNVVRRLAHVESPNAAQSRVGAGSASVRGHLEFGVKLTKSRLLRISRLPVQLWTSLRRK